MGLADLVLRRGHLSEDALIDVWTTGLRPAHLDSCDQCAARALETSRWLEDVQDIGRADADAVFSDERLEAQRDSVMHRLAQLDRPSKVISFPAAAPAAREMTGARRGSPAWLFAAAAAGIMIGVVSMELSHMIPFGAAQPAPVVASAPAPTASSAASAIDEAGLLDGVFERPSFGALHALDEMTPRVADVVLASNSRVR
jgi:hypothetical protein